MSESPSQPDERKNPEPDKPFGFDDLSDVGKLVVEYYREVDSLPIPTHRDSAIKSWLNHVSNEEEFFVKTEWQQMNARVAGGYVVRALAMNEQEWKAMLDEQEKQRQDEAAKALPKPKKVSPMPPPRSYQQSRDDINHGIQWALQRNNPELAAELQLKLHELERDFGKQCISGSVQDVLKGLGDV